MDGALRTNAQNPKNERKYVNMGIKSQEIAWRTRIRGKNKIYLDEKLLK